jgi:hypothetical protein
MLHNPNAFCLKQCNKIGYYLQLLQDIEIIRMKVEFFQDETGFIQLYNASEIWTRKDPNFNEQQEVIKQVDIKKIIAFDN